MAQRLIVEGKDGYVLSALCKAQGLALPSGYHGRAYENFVVNAGGISQISDAIKVALLDPTTTNIGIVIDANQVGVSGRQQSILAAIRRAYPDYNGSIEVGERGWSAEIKSGLTLGLWIMPDNRNSGYLEHFLTQLIRPDNPRLALANRFLEQAIAEELEGFKDARHQKALLSLFLALQEEPGMNYQTAVAKGVFNHRHPSAQDFLTWFAETFRLG